MFSSLPAPSMIVVFSLPTSTRLARPSALMSVFSSLRPSSSATTVPLVRIAMSSSMALRRSPKPGALTAQVLRMPRRLFHHERGERLAVDVFGDDEEGTAGLGDLLQDRQEVTDV